METLTLNIENPVILNALADATRKGLSAQSYALELMETSILSRQSFEELAEPLAQDFDANGMSEDELDALIEAERQAIWDERQRQQ